MPARKPTNRRKRLASAKSNSKGNAFELQVREILAAAKKQSHDRVTYKSKPRVKLQSNELRFPDFSIKIEMPHEVRHIQVECQNRSLLTKDILHKIYYLRAKHYNKTFIFVYAGKLGASLRRGFKSEGVIAHNLEEFRAYIHDSAVISGYVWGGSGVVRSQVVTPQAERLALLSKTQTAFHSHPEGIAQIQEFLKQVDSRPPASGGEDNTR